MTLVQLRHLVALALTGSFSKAAETQFVTQPALSRSIRALEAELGMPLFDRVGRRIEPTPFGRDTLIRARELLADADELQSSSQRIREGGSGVLRIGLGSGPGAMLMTPLLLQAANQRPELHVEIARAGTPVLVQALRARALDALVVDARSLQPASDLHAEFVHEMRGALMVRRGHPLAKLRRGVAFDEVLRYPIASTPLSDEVTRLFVEHFGPQAHLGECVSLRCEEIASLVEVTKGSNAVLIAIRAAAPELVELTMKPQINATARFGLVTLARRTEAPGLAFVRTLMSERLLDAPSK